MGKEKAEKIIEADKEMTEKGLSLLKEKLGDDYFYGELKMALAWHAYLTSKEDVS